MILELFQKPGRHSGLQSSFAWSSMNGYKLYKFFKDNIILSKMFYLQVKSTELPDVGPREFSFLST